LLLSLEFDKLGHIGDRRGRRCVRLVICGRGVGTLCIVLALLPSLHSVQDGLVGVRVAWTQ
jgi:hypothetical protein